MHFFRGQTPKALSRIVCVGWIGYVELSEVLCEKKVARVSESQTPVKICFSLEKTHKLGQTVLQCKIRLYLNKKSIKSVHTVSSACLENVFSFVRFVFSYPPY